MSALPGVAVGGTVGTVLDAWDDVDTDTDTGEIVRHAQVLTFGKAAGRDAVRVPELAVAAIDPAALTPPRPRHNETRQLCGWLAAQKRMVDVKQRQMLDVLVELAA